MGEVVIRLDGRMLERLAYWIVILVLAILLIFSYVGNDGDTKKEEVVEEPEVLAPVDDVEPEPETPTIDETCSDDIKNQDETAVDCGGICTTINGEYWYDNTCNDDPEPEEPSLSGSIEFSVTNVEEQAAPGDGTTALKVKSFQIKITNGEERNTFPTVTAYVKTTGGVYLNQFGDTYDEYTPYLGPFDIGKVAPGESVTKTFDEAGSYLFEQTGYDLGDDFKFVVVLEDDDGDKIDEISKTVRG